MTAPPSICFQCPPPGGRGPRWRPLLRALGGTLLAAACLASGALPAAPEAGGGFERCRQAVLALREGRIVKVELKLERGARLYEFDIRGPDGRDWDLECEPASGEVLEIEQELTAASHPEFAARAALTEAAARDIALAAYPGDIIELEYELESSGLAVYEFDILMPDGRVLKVEVDAASGDMDEADLELWQVGFE